MMFCPECRAEYREGFTKCADCGVRLVGKLPAPSPVQSQFVDLEEVLTTGDPGQIAVVKSVLDAGNISYLVQGEQFSSIRAPIPVRFLVPKEQLASARKLLKKLL
jgi:putative signal transducing protein